MRETSPPLEHLAARADVFDLGRPLFVGMPQSPNHPPYWHALPRRHGDSYRDGSDSAANDIIVTGTHVGTHIDALSHVSHEGRMHGGLDAALAQVGGRFEELGVHTIEPIVSRGVMLDIPSVLGEEICPGDYEVTPEDLDRAVERQGTQPRPGDALLIRTGWGRHFGDRDLFMGTETGAPGVSEEGAKWIAETGARVAGAETIAFEHIPPGRGHSALPAHRVLLVEHGIYIIETMDLAAVAEAQVYEFLFVAAPLKLVGATGSPVRPLAINRHG